MKMKLPFVVRSGSLAITFTERSGGMPASVTVREADGRVTPLFQSGSMRIVIELADGRRLYPVADTDRVRRFKRNGALRVEFANLMCLDDRGQRVLDYQLSIQHEFYPDGTAFTNAFFSACRRPALEIVCFAMEAELDCTHFDDVRWSAPSRPKQVDGAFIMADADRFLPRGKNVTVDPGLLPLVGFYMSRRTGPSLYAELFMEGSNTLSQNPEDNASSVIWRDGSPLVRWVIQKCPFVPLSVCQWRNQWGWVIRPAAGKRHKPPLRMYHYFDNFQRFPNTEQVEAMARAGCDVLTMHENWRLDAQNGGVPYDAGRFENLLEELHERQIRLAVYVRGNEESVAERGAEWFDPLMQRNFDGLYVDYGGPFHFLMPPDEVFNGGRIHFRRHYLNWRNLRRRVGRDGLLYSHTGPWFSALGLSYVDGYVSGEGERGLLVRGRAEHEYFSMAAVCPGTMWVAAFPEYTSPRMTPFLAATGQYPHSTLGKQLLTSSLAHPPEPGINDQAFQSLWRIWSVFRDERDVIVFNDYNTTAMFPDDPDIGHYLMVNKDQSMALLVLSNFSETARDSSDCTIAWPFPINGMAVRLLDGSERHPSTAPITLSLPGYGVAGVLFTAPAVDITSRLSSYRLLPSSIGALGQAYLSEVAEQKRLRELPSDWLQAWLVVSVPLGALATYEDSLTLDLYNNTLELVEIVEEGKLRHVTWIDRRGAVDASEPSEQLFAGDTAQAIDLNALLSPGTHRLAIRSCHHGEPFYSFCYATLSPSPDVDNPRARRLAFMNEVETDRSCLTFTVHLSAKAYGGSAVESKSK